MVQLKNQLALQFTPVSSRKRTGSEVETQGKEVGGGFSSQPKEVGFLLMGSVMLMPATILSKVVRRAEAAKKEAESSKEEGVEG